MRENCYFRLPFMALCLKNIGNKMKLDAYLQPSFVEKELQFSKAVVIMIDVFRASTTICVALNNGAKEILPIEDVDKAIRLYSNLDRESRFIGGERNGIRQNGFNAGNSPEDYAPEAVKDKTVIFTTTNGTQVFNKCKSAKAKFVGAFVNLHALAEHIKKMTEADPEIAEICVICAGNEGQLAYEDATCAGAYINCFKEMFAECELTDAALVASAIYERHKNELYEFVSNREHGKYLKSIGFEKDTQIAMQTDSCQVIPQIEGNIIKIAK